MIQRSETIAALSKALAGAQSAMKPVPKESKNPFFQSKYADLSTVWEHIRPHLASNGLSIIQGAASDASRVSVETMLLHESGEWASSTVTANAKDASPQSVGSAITYLRRYGLQAMVGVVADEDDDGNAAQDRGGKPKDQPRTAKDKPAADGSGAGRATVATQSKPPAVTPAAKDDDAANAQKALFAVANELGLGVKAVVAAIGPEPVSCIYACGIKNGEAEDDSSIMAAIRMIGAPMYEKDKLHFVVARELSPLQMRTLAKELRDIKVARMATRDSAEMFGDPGPSDDDLK